MYYLILIFIYPVSLLPFPVLYLLSDVAYFLIYYVVGYRKEVVWDNLKHAFPDRSEQELLEVRKKFYQNFCDQWLETIKLLTISEKELKRRMAGDWEVLQQLGVEGRNTYAVLGHTFNWEWANVACQYHIPQQYACVYLTVTNKGFDRLMLKIRTRSNAWMISMKALKSGLSKLKQTQYVLALAADQNPSEPELAMWLPFMNREAPFFRGPEQLARRAKAAVVFAGITKIKRGYYYMNMARYCDDASTTGSGDILNAYVAFLERQLNLQPANWLWTHKRWKYKRKK